MYLCWDSEIPDMGSLQPGEFPGSTGEVESAAAPSKEKDKLTDFPRTIANTQGLRFSEILNASILKGFFKRSPLKLIRQGAPRGAGREGTGRNFSKLDNI